MFELMYSSGLRVSELAGLDVAYRKADTAGGAPASLGWIDLDAGEVVVTGKGGKMRKVPVGAHAVEALDGLAGGAPRRRATAAAPCSCRRAPPASRRA